MRLRDLFLIAAVGALVLSSCTRKSDAVPDIILHNAKVLTVDRDFCP